MKNESLCFVITVFILIVQAVEMDAITVRSATQPEIDDEYLLVTIAAF